MRIKFEEQLAQLNNNLIEMGALIENAISLSTKALINQDAELAKSIVAGDCVIDDKEKEIEALCLKLLLQQQPVAKDLRLISTALKMITDMERIADQASDIAEITVFLVNEKYIKKLEHISQMAEATIKMVTQSIDAYVNKNIDLAHEIIKYDDVVDDLFFTIKGELIAIIREDASNGQQALDLLMIAKYFERIGDHAVNIAEWVVFSITGQHKNKKII